MKSADQSGTTSGVLPQSILRAGADSQAPTSIGPGTVLDSKYLVGEIIGEGAFGIVYAARNLELDEKVALKVMRPEAGDDKALVGRFAREAKAAAAIKSEYVASVYDVGSTKNGPPFIVMEFLEGKDLGTYIQEKGALPARNAVEYALQVCEALAVAHSKGIIHRDIKPENLLLTERAGGMRIVKVLDFGISKAALTGSIFGNDIPIVKTTNLVGTPLYMSPEQVRSAESIDVRSDIWSLGMVLYELLTGATAFDGSSIPEICAAIIEKPPTPIEVYRNDLPAGLVDVLYRCLEKDINRRYPNVAELAVALMPFGPKRSRLNVERAVAVLKSSGHVADSYEVSDSAYPPSSSPDSERMLGSSSALRLSVPRVDAGATASTVSTFPPIEGPTTKSKTLVEAGLESVPAATSASTAPKSKSSSTPLILGIVAIVSVAAATAFVVRPMFSSAGPPPPPTPSAATTAIPVVAPPPAPTPSAEPAASTKPAPPVEASAEPKTAVKPPPFAPTPPPKWLTTAAPVKPKPGASATPTAPAPAPAPAPAEAPAPADTSTGRTFRRGL